MIVCRINATASTENGYIQQNLILSGIFIRKVRLHHREYLPFN